MSILDDVGPAAILSGSVLAAFNDPEVRRVPGGIASFMWASAARAWVENNLPGPAPTFQNMNRLVGWGGEVWRKSQALQGAVTRSLQTGIPATIDGNRHIAPDLNARDPGGPLGPAFWGRAEAEFLREGQLVKDWVTVRFGNLAPVDTSDFLNTMSTAAEVTTTKSFEGFADFTGRYDLRFY